MFQFALERALFRFKQDGPTCKPLLQLPPAIARKARGRAYKPLLFISYFTYSGALRPRIPRHGLRRNRFLVREGRAKVPGRIGKSSVQAQAGRTDMQATVAVAARDRIINLAIIEPESIRPIC